MVFGRPALWHPTLQAFGLGYLPEKGILTDLSLAQEIKEQWLERMVGHERFSLTSEWGYRLNDTAGMLQK